MLLEVSSLGIQPIVGSAADVLVSTASPVALSLQLVDGERLDDASLVLRRMGSGMGSGMATPSILFDRGGASSTVMGRSTMMGSSTRSAGGIQWMTAGWGEARRVLSLTVTLAPSAERPRVRVLVARGDGGWHLPPGSVTAAGEGDEIRVTLYDTVADRVRVELLDADDRPVAVALDDEHPLDLDLGNDPHDLSLAVQGSEPMVRWSGAIPDAGLVVSDLAQRLESVLAEGGHDRPIVLELRAEVAGDLELEWAFATSATTVRAAQ